MVCVFRLQKISWGKKVVRIIGEHLVVRINVGEQMTGYLILPLSQLSLEVFLQEAMESMSTMEVFYRVRALGFRGSEPPGGREIFKIFQKAMKI